MRKEYIIVPKGVRYVGERDEFNNQIWNYNLEEYNFPHILNKKLTGCGFTEYCLRNNQNIILVSPRKFLLENKEEQHLGEVYYFRNELESSISYDDSQPIKDLDRDYDDTIIGLDKLKDDLIKAYKNCESVGKPFKILVTYDSFGHVKDALRHYRHDFLGNTIESDIFNQFQVVVDEFQSIFIDSRFKSDTEIELLNNLKDVRRVCFVSATPILEKYLDRLDEFKDLPYYEFDWETDDPGRTKKPMIEIRFIQSITKSASQVIQSYLSGKFETRLNSRTGDIVESKEATFFMNSVNGICKVIRSNRLHLDQCNILCANTKTNEKKIKAAFNEVLKKEFEEKKKDGFTRETEKLILLGSSTNVIGRIPVRGEPHKMFTFCTRTVYLGADFYSTNARTFIFSDSNIDCLSVDISMDLEQIIGRQRLDINPWKNTALMYIKTTVDYKGMTREEFDNVINAKKKVSNDLLSGYDQVNDESKKALAINYQKVAITYKYRDDYVSVTRIKNEITGETTGLKPVFNNLVLVSEERAFDVQQLDYKDRFSVFTSVKGQDIESIEDNTVKLAEDINSLRDVSKKLKLIIEFSEKESTTEKDVLDLLELLPGKYKDYYFLLGPDKIKACGYYESRIKKEWRKIMTNNKVREDVDEKILTLFESGKRYSKSRIKEILNELYTEMGFEKKAKATDLEIYYAMKPVKFQNDSGKWINGFEILGKR